MANEPAELYRLALRAEVPEDAWKKRLQWKSSFTGLTGLDDVFIHLSTADQVAGTAAAYFAGKTDVMLLRFAVKLMREEANLDIRWEAAVPLRPGEKSREGKFPHIYGGPIPFACLAAPPVLLALDSDGKHVLPPLGLVEAPSIERGGEDGYAGNVARI